jgi:Na+-driven multidrug efflux pump
MGSYFCVLKHSGLSFAQNAISAICFRIPLAWLACRQSVNALMLMGLAAPAGSLFQDIFCLIAWKRLKQKSKPLLQATAAEA